MKLLKFPLKTSNQPKKWLKNEKKIKKNQLKNGTEVTSNLSSNVIGDSNGETNVSHKLLLTNTQVSGICKNFLNNSSANIKLSKTQLSKMVQFGGFLDRL